MKQIDISDLKPGMVLAKNVYGKSENLLMGKGVPLSSEKIEQLSCLGIKSLWVEAPDERKEPSGEDITKITKEVREMLDSQFEQVSHNLIMKELKEVFARYLIKRMSR